MAGQILGWQASPFKFVSISARLPISLTCNRGIKQDTSTLVYQNC